MSVLIGHASSDERGKYSGGIAGEQNNKEVYKREYYNRPFLKVIRANTADMAEKMAEAMDFACENPNIGYDQGQRTTLYTAAKPYGFNPSKVVVPCETDCSALVAVCGNYAGVNVSKDVYTGNLEQAFVKTGMFKTVYSSSKDSAPEDIIKRGDILLYPYHHVAIALTDGSGIKQGFLLEDNVWRWYDNGVLARKKWITHNHHKYRMGNNGELLTGWHKVSNNDGIIKWFYFEDDGDYMGALWVSDSEGGQERLYIE